jgi:hypothetical protein
MQEYTKEVRKETKFNFTATDDIKSTINILIPEAYVKDVRIIKLSAPLQARTA